MHVKAKIISICSAHFLAEFLQSSYSEVLPAIKCNKISVYAAFSLFYFTHADGFTIGPFYGFNRGPFVVEPLTGPRLLCRIWQIIRQLGQSQRDFLTES